MHFDAAHLEALLVSYGYLAVFGFVLIESLGIPFPGETMLVAAAIYAGSTQHLSIGVIIVAASVGAILGDNLGFWIGREGGFRLLVRYGHYVRLTERRLKLGQYLFARRGTAFVMFGRFVAVLRTWAAFLAGANRMPWRAFLLANGLGGIVWSVGYGLLGYGLGNQAHSLAGRIGFAVAVMVILLVLAASVYIRRNVQRLEDEAAAALPGSIRGATEPDRSFISS